MRPSTLQTISPQASGRVLGLTDGAAPQRVLGGAGLLVVVVLLLTLPLLVALRGAGRRRRAVRAPSPTAAVDAWSESARRLKDSA